MNKQLKLAYFAGILDGEGCFTVVLHKATNRYIAVMSVMNTDTTLMDWLVSNFGGTVYHRTSPSNKSHWKDRYEWKIYTKAMDALLPKVIPYLVIKKKQAETLLELRRSLSSAKREKPVSLETLAYREGLRHQIRSLNDRRNLH